VTKQDGYAFQRCSGTKQFRGESVAGVMRMASAN